MRANSKAAWCIPWATAPAPKVALPTDKVHSGGQVTVRWWVPRTHGWEEMRRAVAVAAWPPAMAVGAPAARPAMCHGAGHVSARPSLQRRWPCPRLPQLDHALTRHDGVGDGRGSGPLASGSVVA